MSQVLQKCKYIDGAAHVSPQNNSMPAIDYEIFEDITALALELRYVQIILSKPPPQAQTGQHSLVYYTPKQKAFRRQA